MMARKGMAIGQGKGYKNIVVKDPLVHRLSAMGVKQTVPVYEVTAKPFGDEFKKSLRRESELFKKYAVFKSAEKSKLYRNIRRKQLEKRKMFIESVLADKSLDIDTYTYHDFLQGLKEYVTIKNKYGTRKINVTPSPEQLEKEGKKPYADYRGFNEAQVNRVDKPEYWKPLEKKLRDQFEYELDWTNKQLQVIGRIEEQKPYLKEHPEFQRYIELEKKAKKDAYILGVPPKMLAKKYIRQEKEKRDKKLKGKGKDGGLGGKFVEAMKMNPMGLGSTGAG